MDIFGEAKVFSLKTEHKKVIDVMQLLKDINNHPPKNMEQLNTIILSQEQYDLPVVMDE
jgi:hypothetical protein